MHFNKKSIHDNMVEIFQDLQKVFGVDDPVLVHIGFGVVRDGEIDVGLGVVEGVEHEYTALFHDLVLETGFPHPQEKFGWKRPMIEVPSVQRTEDPEDRSIWIATRAAFHRPVVSEDPDP